MLLDLRLGEPDDLSGGDGHPVQDLDAHIAAVAARQVAHLAEAGAFGATSS